MRKTAKRKPKYQLKHEYIKGIVPKPAYELADSFIDHMGEIIAKIDPIEALGFMLGLNFGLDLQSNWKQNVVYGISGALAVRGLSSPSENVGLASAGVLALYGANFVIGDSWKENLAMQKKWSDDLKTSLEDPALTEAERFEMIKRAYESAH